MFRPILGLGGIAAAAVLLASCSSGGSSAPPSPSTTSSSGTASSASVSLASTPLGMVLVNAQGLTLYLFQADTPTMSACTGTCVSAWPPATVSGTPTAGPGLTPSLLTTITRADGTKQLEYNGHPLYTFAGDSAAGQTNGEGNTSFGAPWFALNASGSKA